MLGIGILRIGAFAELMFAASIVAYGVFVGCGQYICSQSDEFWQYLGCPADTGSMALPPTMGATGRSGLPCVLSFASGSDFSCQALEW